MLDPLGLRNECSAPIPRAEPLAARALDLAAQAESTSICRGGYDAAPGVEPGARSPSLAETHCAFSQGDV
jgi:hypothetical protein